jgi:hypothetical protein
VVKGAGPSAVERRSAAPDDAPDVMIPCAWVVIARPLYVRSRVSLDGELSPYQ